MLGNERNFLEIEALRGLKRGVGSVPTLDRLILPVINSFLLGQTLFLKNKLQAGPRKLSSELKGTCLFLCEDIFAMNQS